MRRLLAMLLSLVLLVTTAATGFAASGIRVLFDEQEVQFDASPFMENDRTLVPVRALAERLGFTVGWDEHEQKITLTRGDRTILLWIGSTKVVANGTEATLDAAPKKVNNRTFVPVRFVAERLGAHVSWEQNQRAVVVTSGKAFFRKMNEQAKPVDQKVTGDLKLQMSLDTPDQPQGSGITLDTPMHMDLHVYKNDMLMAMTVQKPSGAGTALDSLSVQMALKDGAVYTQDPTTRQWRPAGGMNGSISGPGLSLLSPQQGFGDPMKLQTDVLQDAVVSVGGQEVIDGVTAVRLDVDLSKVKFGPLFAQLAASMPVSPDGGKPSVTGNIDRYVAQYLINPDTQFVHKVTLDMALSMVTGDPDKGLHTKVAMKGELRGTPVSEPIIFPDFSAPGFTAEQKLAAQTYWDGLTNNVPMEPCVTAAKEADAHWQDSAFTAGQTAAVKAAACFTQRGQALAALKPPADFAEAHRALSLAVTASATAYTGYGEAFALAARGDTAASAAIKADAVKGAIAADKALMQAAMQMMQAAAKYGFK